MANGYKYVCTVFTLFGTAPACVRGSGQRISCMSGTRYRSPGPHPPAGGTRARGRAGCWRIRVGRRYPGLSGLPGSEARPRSCGLLANQGGAAVFRSAGSAGSAGSGGSPAAVRVVGKQGWPGASRSGATRARVCRIKRVSVCPAAGEGSRMPIRVSVGPKAGERTNAGPPSAGCPACWDSVGQSTEPRRRLAGKGRLLRVRALCRACPQK